MTCIYLIRHAEAEGNLYRIVQGQGNSNLTTRGWRQVAALEKRFSAIPVDAVYASDLYRTCATATAIYRPKGLPLQRRRDLREIYVGDWEQQTWGDIARTQPQQLEWFTHQLHRWHISGAETPQEVLKRVREAVFSIAAENDGKTVAVVSHGYAIRLLLAQLQGIPLEGTGETPTGQNTAVSLLEYEAGQMRVVIRDDISHLQTPEYLATEKPRRKIDPLEPGLWFCPPQTQSQREKLVSLAAGAWAEGAMTGGFDPQRLLRSVAARPTLLGYSGDRAVGLVQLGPQAGWISLACIQKDFRQRGFGIQLIGQAVQWTRAQGGGTLHMALAEGSAAEDFLRGCGFAPDGHTPDGRTVFTKDISFDPEILRLGL